MLLACDNCRPGSAGDLLPWIGSALTMTVVVAALLFYLATQAQNWAKLITALGAVALVLLTAWAGIHVVSPLQVAAGQGNVDCGSSLSASRVEPLSGARLDGAQQGCKDAAWIRIRRAGKVVGGSAITALMGVGVLLSVRRRPDDAIHDQSGLHGDDVPALP